MDHGPILPRIYKSDWCMNQPCLSCSPLSWAGHSFSLISGHLSHRSSSLLWFWRNWINEFQNDLKDMLTILPFKDRMVQTRVIRERTDGGRGRGVSPRAKAYSLTWECRGLREGGRRKKQWFPLVPWSTLASLNFTFIIRVIHKPQVKEIYCQKLRGKSDQ